MEPNAAGVLQRWVMWLRALKFERQVPASVLPFSMYEQMIQATLAGQGVALGRGPLIDSLLRQRKLVAPFKQAIASPRSDCLIQLAAAVRKPEVRAFLAWLHAEASADAASAGVGRRAVA